MPGKLPHIRKRDDIHGIPERQDLARRIKRWRLHTGFSCRGLSKACKFPVSSITRLEKAESDPLYSTLVRLAKGMKITLYQLLFQDPLVGSDIALLGMGPMSNAAQKEMRRIYDEGPVGQPWRSPEQEIKMREEDRLQRESRLHRKDVEIPVMRHNETAGTDQPEPYTGKGLLETLRVSIKFLTDVLDDRADYVCYDCNMRFASLEPGDHEGEKCPNPYTRNCTGVLRKL